MSNIVPNGKRIDFSELVAPGEYDELESIREQMLRQVTALPRRGTPVAELTERDRLALALAAGAPYAIEMDGTRLTFRTTVPVGIADRGDGRYIVAIGPRNGCCTNKLLYNASPTTQKEKGHGLRKRTAAAAPMGAGAPWPDSQRH